MKISEALNSVPVTPAAGSATTTDALAPQTAETPVDRVTTTNTEDLKSSVATGVTTAAAERSTRLQALAQQVRSGLYRPMASALAEQILAEAELDARLTKSFR